MRFIQIVLYILGLLLLIQPVQTNAQVHVRYDSSNVTVRAPADDVLEKYRMDPDFTYDLEDPPETTWWAHLRRWIWNRLVDVFGRVPVRVYEWSLYAVLAGVVFFAITRLLRMSPRSLFSGHSSRPAAAFEMIEGDIRAVDFDAQIKEALSERAYRRAVRLYYLKALQQLAERELIDWQPDKTNHHYLDELKAADLRSPFTEMTQLFEYIWYGDFPIDEALFNDAHRSFARFEQALKTLETLRSLPAEIV